MRRTTRRRVVGLGVAAAVVAAVRAAGAEPGHRRGAARSGAASPGASPAGRAASPAAAPPAGAVLYEAGEAGGFAAWPLAGGWRHVGGALVHDGAGGELVAPYRAGVAAYAVEAEVRVARTAGAGLDFGIAARDGGVRAGVSADGTVHLFVGEEVVSSVGIIAEAGGPDLGWHAYRLAVAADGVALAIDGSEVARVGPIDPARAGAGGQAGVWAAAGAEVALRRFAVIAL
jgi:hypothetical protein